MKQQPSKLPASAFDVVVLVASAGGHAAVMSVLSQLPADFPLPLLVMHHLGPDSTYTVEIYARTVPFAVEWVQTGSALARGTLLVCPPRAFVELLPDGTCVVTACARGAVDRPMNRLLDSVARSFGERAIAVVLSGMGDDGAAGARQLRLRGGCVLVQSEAEFADMPNAAMQNGAAQVVLPLDELAPLLVDLAAGAPVPHLPTELQAVEALFAGEGLARAAMRAVDWSATALGPVLNWPESLLTAVRNAMSSRFPTCIYWGREFVQIYNEAFLAVLGAKHSPAGKPARLTWPELWSTLGPQLESVLHTGSAVFAEDQLFQTDRSGYLEEIYLTVAYSPLHGPRGSILGVLNTATDSTGRVRAARRLQTLRDLAAIDAGESPFLVVDRAAKVLMLAPLDVPFALLYLLDGGRARANLGAACGVEAGSSAAPHTITLVDEQVVWPLASVVRSGEALAVTDLPARLAGLHCGPWPETAAAASLLPLRIGPKGRIVGVLVVGLSPRLRFDAAYPDFVELIAQHISIHLGVAEARRLERERAEHLAELDQAKVEFFSNVSHEFRTPLTLLLAPLEELLRRRETLDAELVPEIDAAVRNGRRLLTLVNTLLDFSQAESNRRQANLEPADLSALTTDIASAFRSTIEAAGLNLRVDCKPLPQPIWVDRDMWEKIVSNLLSNAFKFTFAGEIAVELRPLTLHAELTVSDTGIGIPAQELPNIFKRFHRVQGARARSMEGSGIGLSIVHDLVNRMGGQINVRSVEGRGTTFTIWLPFKPARVLAAPAAAGTEETEGTEETNAEAAGVGTPALAVELAHEAARWLVDAEESLPAVLDDVFGPPAAGARRGRLVVADDNADMRDYLQRLLSPGWEVELAADGTAALEAALRARPDAILADVMMAGLDGFELVRRVREDPRLHSTPVVLLTARAGEDAVLQGLAAGASDYMTKPFAPRELVARVRAVVERSRVQEALRLSEEQFRAFVQASSELVYKMSADWSEMHYLQGKSFLADTERPSRSWLETYIPPEDQPEVLAVIREAIRTKSMFELEHRVICADGTVGWTRSRALPLLGERGEIVEWLGAASDITYTRSEPRNPRAA